MRRAEALCDLCQRSRDLAAELTAQKERPQTWWTLEDQGRVIRTGALDFCSLACLQAWVREAQVRGLYAEDFLVCEAVVVGDALQ